MTIIPTGILGAAAGAGLAQRAGNEVDRAKQEAVAQQRQAELAQKAENAAGIGQTNEDQEAQERDADGRRPWEIDGQKPAEKDSDPSQDASHRPRDPSGQRGGTLDLTG
jgi:hypothetical protein